MNAASAQVFFECIFNDSLNCNLPHVEYVSRNDIFGVAQFTVHEQLSGPFWYNLKKEIMIGL